MCRLDTETESLRGFASYFPKSDGELETTSCGSGPGKKR